MNLFVFFTANLIMFVWACVLTFILSKLGFNKDVIISSIMVVSFMVGYNLFNNKD